MRWLITEKFLDNQLINYVWFLLIVLFGILLQKGLSKLFSGLLYRLIHKYSSSIGYDQFLELLKKPIGNLIVVLAFYFAFDWLTFPAQWNLVSIEKFGLRMVLERSFELIIALNITWILLRFADFTGLILAKRSSDLNDGRDNTLIPFIKEAIKVVIVVLSTLTILGSIFNLNVTSIIAGLGIGGLAIALAAKESLENLLGSFTIFFDKPFQTGDYIKFGDTSGTVERIGFRSTRVRTDEKTLLTVPNKKLVDAELNNLTLRQARHVKFFFHLSYSTIAVQLTQIISELKTYLAANSALTPESKVRFFELSPHSQQILVEYYIIKVDYENYLTIKEEVNFTIKNIVENHNATFAILPEGGK